MTVPIHVPFLVLIGQCTKIMHCHCGHYCSEIANSVTSYYVSLLSKLGFCVTFQYSLHAFVLEWTSSDILSYLGLLNYVYKDNPLFRRTRVKSGDSIMYLPEMLLPGVLWHILSIYLLGSRSSFSGCSSRIIGLANSQDLDFFFLGILSSILSYCLILQSAEK